MRKRLIIYECVIRCERLNHVASHYCDLCIYQPKAQNSAKLRKILVSTAPSIPSTLFEMPMKASLTSRCIGMTHECYDLPRMRLEKTYYPGKRNGLTITTTVATIYKGVWITVAKPFVDP